MSRIGGASLEAAPSVTLVAGAAPSVTQGSGCRVYGDARLPETRLNVLLLSRCLIGAHNMICLWTDEGEWVLISW